MSLQCARFWSVPQDTLSAVGDHHHRCVVGVRERSTPEGGLLNGRRPLLIKKQAPRGNKGAVWRGPKQNVTAGWEAGVEGLSLAGTPAYGPVLRLWGRAMQKEQKKEQSSN